jgi:hypothetical protein
VLRAGTFAACLLGLVVLAGPEPGEAATRRGAAAVVEKVWHTASAGYTGVTVALSRPTEYEAVHLRADRKRGLPERIYIDFRGAVLGPKVRKSLPVGDGVVVRVRAGQFDPRTVRVVLDLAKMGSYRTVQATKPFRVTAQVQAVDRAKKPAARGGAARGSGVRRYLSPALGLIPALRPSLGWLRVTRLRGWEGEVQFGFEFDQTETSVEGSPKTTFERMNFTERVALGGSMYVFDPRLANFRAKATIGFFQENLSVASLDRQDRGDLLGFDGDAVFLSSKPYTLRVFGRRNKTTARREFAGTTDVLGESFGATLTLKDLPLHSILGVRRERDETELRAAVGTSRREWIRTRASYDGRRRSEEGDLSVRYMFADVSDEVFPELSYVTHEGTVYSSTVSSATISSIASTRGSSASIRAAPST